MKKWIVTAEMTISVNTIVKAETEKEAIEIASGRGVMGLCHQCAIGEPKVEWVTSGDFDGDPVSLRVEEDE